MMLFFLPLILISFSFFLYPYFEASYQQKESAFIGSKGIAETVILQNELGLISVLDDEKGLRTFKAKSYNRIDRCKPVLIVKFIKDNNVFIVEEFV